LSAGFPNISSSTALSYDGLHPTSSKFGAFGAAVAKRTQGIINSAY
jgi:hypothetical protein